MSQVGPALVQNGQRLLLFPSCANRRASASCREYNAISLCSRSASAPTTPSFLLAGRLYLADRFLSLDPRLPALALSPSACRGRHAPPRSAAHSPCDKPCRCPRSRPPAPSPAGSERRIERECAAASGRSVVASRSAAPPSRASSRSGCWGVGCSEEPRPRLATRWPGCRPRAWPSPDCPPHPPSGLP